MAWLNHPINHHHLLFPQAFNNLIILFFAELTFCQHLRNFESRRSRDYKDRGSKVQVRIPRCNRLGDFEQIQCSNELDNTHCFCVDEYGIEIPGTRAESEDKVNCSTPKTVDCPAASCRMFCSSGFSRNATTGCPMCKCFDPCSDVKCPNGHECEPIEIKCKNDPCPPIPTCRKARSLKDFCPAGSPLAITGTIRPFLCGNDPGMTKIFTYVSFIRAITFKTERIIT